jgi:surface antigen
MLRVLSIITVWRSPRVACGGGQQKWTLAENTLSSCRQPTVGGPVAWKLGEGRTTPHHKYKRVTKCRVGVGGWDVDTSFGTTCRAENGHGTGNWDGAVGPGHWRQL